MRYLKSIGIWAAFTCSPPLILSLRSGRSLRANDIAFFLPFLLIPIIGSLLLASLEVHMNSVKKASAAGVLLGLGIPILGGFLWMKIFPGFESQPAIFLGMLMIIIPSSIGGGLAGWLYCRNEAAIG